MKETYCTCYHDYPNEYHKRKNGHWICVDKYECIRKRETSPKFGFTTLKTKCKKVRDTWPEKKE